MSEFHHVSVLLEECIQGLAIKPDGIYVDGTLGGAGHSSRIAAKLTTGRLIGIDRDNGQAKLSGHPHRRQRRAGGGGNGDEKGRSAAESRRTAGGNYLSFSGRPHCKKRHGRGGEGLHLPAQLPGVRLRQEAPGADRDPQAHRFRGRRAGTESQSAQREAADL